MLYKYFVYYKTGWTATEGRIDRRCHGLKVGIDATQDIEESGDSLPAGGCAQTLAENVKSVDYRTLGLFKWRRKLYYFRFLIFNFKFVKNYLNNIYLWADD